MNTASEDQHLERPLGVEEQLIFRVVAREDQGEGTVAIITLQPVDGSGPPAWEAGAHIDILLENGLERQYSLCGRVKPGEPWRIGVLRESNSRGGSEYIHASLHPGIEVLVRRPRNNFSLVEAPVYQFVAGGIGITPILPMIREVERRGKPWRLIYGGRSRPSMAFLDELAPYGDRVSVWPQDESGHLPIGGIVEGLEPGAVVYCCGPEPLLRAVEGAMANLPQNLLHIERFRPRLDLLAKERMPFDVYLNYSDLSLHVPTDKTIVQVVEAAGLEVMTSCREGTCGTCETGVLEGIPDHRDSYLTPAEKLTNETIMICCSRAKSSKLVLDL